MTIACSKCGGATNEKAITTKFGPTTVGECTSGCVNEKGYPLGTFAKKSGKSFSRAAATTTPPPPPVDREEYRAKAMEAISKNIEGAQELIVKHDLGAKADVLLLADLIGKCMTAMTLDNRKKW